MSLEQQIVENQHLLIKFYKYKVKTLIKKLNNTKILMKTINFMINQINNLKMFNRINKILMNLKK
jgi:hypothetical protein